MCDIARKNIAEFQHRHHGLNTEFWIVHDDVVNIELVDDETVFFMFHPFARTEMTRALEFIERSLTRRPRDVWLIYSNPSFAAIIEVNSSFARIDDYSFLGSRFVVHKSSWSN